jgi:hypothetical protein
MGDLKVDHRRNPALPMKNPLQKPYPRYYSYFTIRLMTKIMFNSELRGQGTPTGA